MWGVDYKRRMEDILYEDLRAYLSENKLNHVFELPILGYADVSDPGFMDCYEADLTLHPKEIYRPGTTVIVSFLPFKYDYVKSNFEGGNTVSDEWRFAYEKSIMVSSHIGGTIMRALEDMGREASLTSLPGDWDEEKERPEWSHKIAAYIAGMGGFGPGGSFKTKSGSLGRFNSIITELPMEYTERDDTRVNVVDAILCSTNMTPKTGINCPGDAITHAGINAEKCRNFCRSLGQVTPESDACGKCFL